MQLNWAEAQLGFIQQGDILSTWLSDGGTILKDFVNLSMKSLNAELWRGYLVPRLILALQEVTSFLLHMFLPGSKLTVKGLLNCESKQILLSLSTVSQPFCHRGNKEQSGHPHSPGYGTLEMSLCQWLTWDLEMMAKSRGMAVISMVHKPKMKFKEM